MKIFIACSKHFYHKIPLIKKELEKSGHKVTLPNSYDNSFREEEIKKLSEIEHRKFKQKMMKLHEPKIKKNDAILVLNLKKNGIPNYIGGGTFMEIVKAWELNKKIFLLNQIPKCSFTDEIKGINPILIERDLTKIK